MKECSGLLHVRIKFEVWYLLTKRFSHVRRMPLTPEELAERAMGVWDLQRILDTYRTKELLEMQSLVSLTIEVWPKVTAFTTRGMQSVLPDCWAIMEELAEWLRKAFEERGRSVDVVLVESTNEGLRWRASWGGPG